MRVGPSVGMFVTGVAEYGLVDGSDVLVDIPTGTKSIVIIKLNSVEMAKAIIGRLIDLRSALSHPKLDPTFDHSTPTPTRQYVTIYFRFRSDFGKFSSIIGLFSLPPLYHHHPRCSRSYNRLLIIMTKSSSHSPSSP